MRNRHGIVRGLTAVLLLCALALPAAGAAAPVTVTVRGTAVVWTDAAPRIEGGRTLVPLRAAAEAMGLDVQWDGAERRVDFSKTYTPEGSVYQAEIRAGVKEFIQKRTVSMWVGSGTYSISNQYGTCDGRTVTEGRSYSREAEMDTAPVLRDNRAYAPIRSVAEQFGYDVLWDGPARTVRLVNELPAGWSYAWSIANVQEEPDPGSLVLSIHTPENLTAARVTDVRVACATTACPSDGPQQPAPAGPADVQRIRATAGPDVSLLDTVRVNYPFQPGQLYTISFTLALTKSNGAEANASGSFQVDLR